jgi:hypothetical protein
MISCVPWGTFNVEKEYMAGPWMYDHPQRFQDLLSDMCGQFPVEANGGGLYAVTFTDDCTYSILECFYFEAQKNRNLWSKRLKNTKLGQRNNLGLSSKRFEPMVAMNMKNRWKRFSRILGSSIRRRHLIHQSNGVSEWMNRTLMEMAEPMTARAKASMKLWAKAVKIASYIHPKSYAHR